VILSTMVCDPTALAPDLKDPLEGVSSRARARLRDLILRMPQPSRLSNLQMATSPRLF
jgi:ACT domain-containing protein